MKRAKRFLWLVMYVAVVTNVDPSVAQTNVFNQAARLGQSVNLGNTLEAPNHEGEWGFRLEDWHFQQIANGGFDSVRVPIRWNAYAQTSSPFTIDPDFFQRIDWVVDQAQRNDLAVIIDLHHYDELHLDPMAHRDRFLSLWQQIATHYQDAPDTVYFELLNEPNEQLTTDVWNALIVDALQVIRPTNPDRAIIVGPVEWNSFEQLGTLELPVEDRHLIPTFHYYDPFPFTHQGAEWVPGSEPWLGTTWTGTNAQQSAIRFAFNRIRNWSNAQERPIFMGEFGAYSTADIESREAWTRFVASEAEARNFSWAYWEFGAGFGVYDRENQQWNQPIYRALNPTKLFDVSGDWLVDRQDWTALNFAIQLQNTDSRFDLNSDSSVDYKDLQFWSHYAGPRSGDLNADGQWTAADMNTLSAGVRSSTADYAFDLNRDNLVNVDDRIYWVRTVMNTFMGDANLDGQFDTSDFVGVFAKGLYETGMTAGWAEGDWSGDGLFDSRDLIVAFQEPGYQQGPRTVRSVPEPDTFHWSLVMISAMRIIRGGGRRRTQENVRSR